MRPWWIILYSIYYINYLHVFAISSVGGVNKNIRIVIAAVKISSLLLFRQSITNGIPSLFMIYSLFLCSYQIKLGVN